MDPEALVCIALTQIVKFTVQFTRADLGLVGFVTAAYSDVAEILTSCWIA
jgi:predicted anti-sigma-YlaC factor YlaD